jgi:hypothetical protein
MLNIDGSEIDQLYEFGIGSEVDLSSLFVKAISLQ